MTCLKRSVYYDSFMLTPTCACAHSHYSIESHFFLDISSQVIQEPVLVCLQLEHKHQLKFHTPVNESYSANHKVI